MKDDNEPPSVAEHVEATRQGQHREHRNNPLFYNSGTLGVTLFVFMLIFNGLDGPLVIFSFPICSILVGFLSGVAKAKGLEEGFWVGFSVLIYTSPILFLVVLALDFEWQIVLIVFGIANTVFFFFHFVGRKWESHSIKLRSRHCQYR